MRKIDVVKHMLQRLANTFDQTSYIKIKEEMVTFDKQVGTM